MRLKRKKKTGISNPWPLAALGVALAAAGGAIAFLRSRNRREKAASAARGAAGSVGKGAQQAVGKTKGAAHEATAPIRQPEREYDDVTLARKHRRAPWWSTPATAWWSCAARSSVPRP